MRTATTKATSVLRDGKSDIATLLGEALCEVRCHFANDPRVRAIFQKHDANAEEVPHHYLTRNARGGAADLFACSHPLQLLTANERTASEVDPIRSVRK